MMADFPRALSPEESPNPRASSNICLTEPHYKPTKRLEKEDIVIIVLSAILLVATLWLASYIL